MAAPLPHRSALTAVVAARAAVVDKRAQADLRRAVSYGTLLKLTGRVVNDRVSLDITRRRPRGGILPHVAAGGGIRLTVGFRWLYPA